MIWFSADFHLDHKRICEYSNRPFKDVDEMNEAIVDNCNLLVAPNDDFFFLGDFAFSKDIHRIVELRQRIKCRNIYFIYGNHDKIIRNNRDFLKKYFRFLGDYAEENNIYFGTQKKPVVLTHYAFRTWNRSHHGSYHLYGHSHGSLPDDPNSLSFDVGVDCWGFKPINTDQVEAKMKTKTWKPIDHHGARDFEKGN